MEFKILFPLHIIQRNPIFLTYSIMRCKLIVIGKSQSTWRAERILLSQVTVSSAYIHVANYSLIFWSASLPKWGLCLSKVSFLIDYKHFFSYVFFFIFCSQERCILRFWLPNSSNSHKWLLCFSVARKVNDIWTLTRRIPYKHIIDWALARSLLLFKLYSDIEQPVSITLLLDTWFTRNEMRYRLAHCDSRQHVMQYLRGITDMLSLALVGEVPLWEM